MNPAAALLELRQEANNAWISLREQQYMLKQAEARFERAHAAYREAKERQRQEAVSRKA